METQYREDTPEYQVYYYAYMLAHNDFKNNESSRRVTIQKLEKALNELKTKHLNTMETI